MQEVQGAFHCRKVDIAQSGPQSGNAAPDQAALDCQRAGQQPRTVKGQVTWPTFGETVFPGGVHQAIQEFIFLAQHLGHAPDTLAGAGVQFFQKGDQFKAQPVAIKPAVLVAGVQVGLQLARLQVGHDLLTPGSQQGPHQGNFRIPGIWQAAPFHAAQPSQACPAQQVHQGGFDLVIGGMAYRNRLGLVLAGLLEQEAVAQGARRLFQRHPLLVGKSGHIGLLQDKGQISAGSQRGHVFGFPPRFRAQPVIQVGDDQFVAQAVQCIQQAKTVRPTRYPNQKQLARIDLAKIIRDIPNVFQHHLGIIIEINRNITCLSTRFMLNFLTRSSYGRKNSDRR